MAAGLASVGSAAQVAPMADVVDLAKARAERQPHMSGNARCLACGHRWAAVAPVGVVWMQCPSPQCGLLRGRLTGPAEQASGMHWTCGCGSDLFHWHNEIGLYCPNCGAAQQGFDAAQT